MTIGGNNYQYLHQEQVTLPDGSSVTIVRASRFDINLSGDHVSKAGPHLNLETTVTETGNKNNVLYYENEHWNIDPSTIRSGDHP